MASELTCIEILPTAAHTYSVIWLHGLGADGHDFEGIVPELHLHAAAHIHFIFPNAPIQAVTINGGAKMRSWYDILEATLDRKVDTDGIYQSAAAINSLIQKEIDKGIPADHILLAGFSQGGVIALHTGLRYPHKLAGIVALSTYLPTVGQLKTEGSAANYNTPIFMAHGILDNVVAIETAKAAYDALNALAYHVKWHDYLMEHSVCIEEIQHIAAFINARFQ
ncbi:alpha/beta hydrolase [Methylovulum psychrotolerans]|uniref:Carboxylesterase n=1 Tax=Methylovulum psychrotolerans TaxID=1704499 RepID=A0A1Z4BXU5_9GAMM|nr:alpha/beta fold hydrolase [Methylovulum psychrotolerans]ASF46082.1 carboxylesterase [Methylovulum psychrotolerans]